MKKLTLVLLASSAFAAEDSLKINEPVDHDLTAGSSPRYEIRLNADDYVAGSIEQHGKVDMAILLPDGSLLRRFPGGANDEKRLFGFIGAGGTAGALLGPAITIGLSVPLGPVNLLVAAIIFLELAVFCVYRLERVANNRQAARRDEHRVGGNRDPPAPGA